MMLEVLKALQKARDYVAAQPPLVKSEMGHAPPDKTNEARVFWYPAEAALRTLCDAAFKSAGIFDIGEDIRSNGVLKVTWCLYLLDGPEAGQPYRLEMEWPVDVSQSMTRPLASVWSLSHAWRHAMMNLLKIRAVDRDATEPGMTPWSRGEREQAAQLDALVGEGPPWATPPAPAMLVPQDAQWEAVGAVVDGEPLHDEDGVCLDAPAAETPDVTLYSLWLSLRETPKAKRWTGLLHAFHEFSGDNKAQRIEESPEFKRWLNVQLSEAA